MAAARLNSDRNPGLGPRVSLHGLEAVIAHVRATWPTAGQEGSTGAERTWLVRGEGTADRLVAHHWPAKPWKTWDGESYYVRVAAIDSEPTPYF